MRQGFPGRSYRKELTDVPACQRARFCTKRTNLTKLYKLYKLYMLYKTCHFVQILVFCFCLSCPTLDEERQGQAPIGHPAFCHARLDRASRVVALSFPCVLFVEAKDTGFRIESGMTERGIEDPVSLGFPVFGKARDDTLRLRVLRLCSGQVRDDTPVVPYRMMGPARRGGPVCPPGVSCFSQRRKTLDPR